MAYPKDKNPDQPDNPDPMAKFMPDHRDPRTKAHEPPDPPKSDRPVDTGLYSINEPGPDAPKPFTVTDEMAYPEGLDKANKAEQPHPGEPGAEKAAKPEAHAGSTDPDELEDEIDQAKEEGDITSSKPKPKRK